MRLPTVPSNPVVKHLNTTYFNKVWNAPADHGRSNFRLYKAAERLQTGSVAVGQSVVGLPTTDAVYAVYKTTYRGINRFAVLPNNQWVTDADLFTGSGVSLLAYAATGRIVPATKVWLRYMVNRDEVLVAIDRTVVNTCLGETHPDLYMTVYKDTTRQSPIVTKYYIVGNGVNTGTLASVVTAQITQEGITTPHGTTVSVNGWVYPHDFVPALQLGDHVTIMSDPDVVGSVDITVDDNFTGYYSELYGEYREILHIPKALNPQGVILTSDTLTTVVYDSATQKGVLGHRLDDNALESITHNDFSMSRTALGSFTQSLGADGIKVRLYVRMPTTANILSDDANHLYDLYALSDVEILNQLLGLSQRPINEWRAENLEKSQFLKLLYRFTGFGSEEVIPDYVEAMGYYDVASVLGQQMRLFTYNGGIVNIRKPARLFGYACAALVYINGLKAPEGSYVITPGGSTTIGLSFKAESGITKGDRVAVYLLEAGLRQAVPYNPTSSAPGILLDNEDYTLVEIHDYTTDQAVWKGSARKGYRPMAYASSEYTVTRRDDGQYLYQVRAKNVGKHYYLIPKYGMTTAVYDLGARVADKSPIVIGLTTQDQTGQSYPMTAYTTMEVYLNKKRLIEGIDYGIKTVEGPSGDVLQNLLAVSNCDYFDLEGGPNVLEVVVHGDSVVSQDTGYAVEELLHRQAVPMIWTRSSSRTFVGGIYQEGITTIGNLANAPGVPNGAPFLIQQMISFGALKLLGDLSPIEDNNLRTRIDRVLGITPPPYPDLVVVDHLHALYSPFLAQITYDIGNGLLTLVDEVDNSRFLRQVKAYGPLLERDPVVGPNHAVIERKFVTLASHYANFAVTDPDQMLRLQRLTGLMLDPSALAIKEVLL